MKNAMKKLTSLLLVALLLVGMIPFAASAASTTVSVQVFRDVDGNEEVSTVSVTVEADTEGRATIDSLFAALGLSDIEGCWVNGHKKVAGQDFPVDATEIKVRRTAYTTPTPIVYCVECGEEVVSGALHMQNCETCDVVWCGSHECPTVEPAPAPAHAEIYWEIKYTEGGAVVKSGTFVPNGKTANVKDILYYHAFERSNEWQEKYECTKAWSTLYQKNVGYEGFVSEGDSVSIVLSPKTGEVKPNKPSQDSTNNGVVDEEWMKDIYLYIYTNNDIIQPSKRVLLNNYSIVNDHKLSKAEILSVVDDYYKATNANNGIIWKGAYVETTNITALDFVAGLDQTNNGSSYIDNLDMARSSANVIIKVRVTGVTNVGTNYTADSSNPKTGDSIYTAMTVMGISAAALASVMYFYNKKRMAL